MKYPRFRASAAALLLLAGLMAGMGAPAPASTASLRASTPSGNTCTVSFTDVPAGAYFYDPVLWLACRGDLSGYGDGSFQPYSTTTRGQLTKILVLAYDLPLLNPAQGHFSDVPPGAPFYPYVETAYAQNIISGYVDGTFRPSDLVTRGQIAKILTRIAGWTQVSPDSGHFDDVPPGSTYYSSVETAVAHGLISGYGDGTFKPYSPASRAQVGKMAYRALNAGCRFFPADNIWNRDISSLPVDPGSAKYIASMGRTGTLHADFGSGTVGGAPLGIPWLAVAGSQPAVPVSFQNAVDSDTGPYPVPPDAPVEGGAASTGARHVSIVSQAGGCTLYELSQAQPQTDGSWLAGAGAQWDLSSNALRPDGLASADAAGLPILPGLVRYEEVAAGAITHALRVTARRTQNRHLWPARHDAGAPDPALPPLGLRLRLKADVDLSSFPPADRVILTALQHYGVFVADTGPSWTISGTHDDRWDNDVLAALATIPGSDFEAVDESGLMIDANSGQALQP
jgi:hypothetical protein